MSLAGFPIARQFLVLPGWERLDPSSMSGLPVLARPRDARLGKLCPHLPWLTIPGPDRQGKLHTLSLAGLPPFPQLAYPSLDRPEGARPGKLHLSLPLLSSPGVGMLGKVYPIFHGWHLQDMPHPMVSVLGSCALSSTVGQCPIFNILPP